MYTDVMKPLTVTVLGAGDAFSPGGLFHSSYLIQGQDTTLLLDCGAHTLAALKKAQISSDRIDVILISHLHGDHFAGVPILFLDYMYINHRSRPLLIAGPRDTARRIQDLFSVLYPHAAAQGLPFELQILEIDAQEQHKIGSSLLTTFPVAHEEEETCFGFRIEIDGKTIVYSGDAGWTEDLPAHFADSDLVLCECTFFDTRLPVHIDVLRLRENRHRFQTGRFVLTHLGEEVLKRRAEIEFELASDGLIIQL
jgi:ribonuclease BN (tRNA processing enzyme)